MLGELAKQLLLQSSTIPDATWQLFEKRETLTTEIVKKIFTLLLPNFKSIYIFLDALDECLPHLREDLLCSLTSSRATTIRMFCTGRSSVAAEAKRHLGSLGFKTMEIYAHEADIRLHLKEQISRDRRKDAMDDQLQEQITNRLIRHRL